MQDQELLREGSVMVKWITWCFQKSGNDGRRPSGVVHERTSVCHAFVADSNGHVDFAEAVSVCGRRVNLYPSEADPNTVRPCAVCTRRLERQDG